MDCFEFRVSNALKTTFGASLALLSLLSPSDVAAQRCVDPLDSADNAAENRYCGAELIDLGVGVAGFGDQTVPSDGCLHLNDDQSSPSIDIRPYFPGGLRFFSTTHYSLYVNTNGNITFSSPLGTYTPGAFPVASRPMIAPYWADVDTRTTADGDCANTPAGVCFPRPEDQVWWHFEPGRAFFTWDEVSYFGCNPDRRMSFQMILSGAEGCGGVLGGDFDVEFRYNRCEWDTGDASGGTGGFLTSAFGSAAQAGFDAGDSINYVEIMTSRQTRVIGRTLCEESNVAIPGIWRFQIRGGTIICPDAGEECTVTNAAGDPLIGACAAGRTNCEGGGVVCVPQIEPRDEICDNIDNDCDGDVDDGEDSALCFSDGQSCINGLCVDTCFEGSCNEGLVCNADNLCVEDLCDGVTCEENERCAGGDCIPVCEGIVCPDPTSCIAGRCVAVCEGLTCDDCTTCSGGECVARCNAGSCGAGDECDTSTGRCVSAGCSGVTCGTGTVCRGGTCVDACLDALCPPGDVCLAGICSRRVRPDAGPPVDAGPRDSGVDSGVMDGSVDADIDAGHGPPPADPGCGCSVPSRTGNGSSAAFLLLGLLGLIVRRRR